MLGQPDLDEAACDELDEHRPAGRVVEVGWTYDEEEVQREMAESMARTEKANSEWARTQNATQNINTKLSEQLVDFLDQSPMGSRNASPRTALGASGRSDMGQSAYYAARNALVVADKMARSKERVESFALRRTAALEEEKRSRERVAAEIEAGHARGIQRHREVLEEQRRRAFASQQRRSEQQKALREFRRDEERQWEAYYARQQEKLSEQRATSPTPSMTSSPGRPGSTGEASNNAANEDIFRTTLQSHNEYASTMERWRQFVAENERRTETYWRKMLHGREHEAGPKPGRMPSRKRTTKLDPAAVKTNQQNHTAKDTQQSFRSNSSRSPVDFSRGLQRMASSDGIALWSTRRLQCIKLAEENSLRDDRHREGKEQSLKAARGRIKGMNGDRTKRAKEQNKAWQERNDQATQRRKDLAITTDEAYVRKLADHARRMEEEGMRMHEERTTKGLLKMKAISDVQTSRVQQQEKVCEAILGKMSKVEEILAEHRRRQNEDMEKGKTPAAKWNEMQATVAERRAQGLKDAELSIKKEMGRKELRTAQTLEVRQQPVLKRQRTLRKEKSAQSPLGRDRSSPLGSLANSLSGALSLPALFGDGGAVEAVPDLGDTFVTRLAAARGQGPARKPSLGAESDASHEELRYKNEFHTELEDRSAKWLSEMRRKKDMMPAF